MPQVLAWRVMHLGAAGTGKYVGAKGTITAVESGHDISNKNTLTITLLR